jgi:hypothetical protein
MLEHQFLEWERNINNNKVELNVGDDNERARLHRSEVVLGLHGNSSTSPRTRKK